jgi:CBS domain containing-hemolysin-like protein
MLEAALVRRFLGRVLHLRETPVARIMRPREAIVWIGQREEARVAAELMSSSGHSRIPVCGRDLDDVVGILHLKDVFLALVGGPAQVTMGSIARQPSLITADMPLASVLATWRHASGTMSLVRDEAGRVIGLVTLADMIDWILAAPPSADGEAVGSRLLP